MSTESRPTHSSTKTQQRRARQDKARAAREAERRAARRRKNLIVSGVVVLVVLVLVGIGIAVGTSSSKKPTTVLRPKDAVTTGAPVAQGAVLVGKATAPVTLDLYEDFNCPICGQFEKADGASLTTMVNAGKVKIRYHMLSFIDDHNGGTYSHRSSAAFAAADTYAGSDKAFQLHAALYANQPDETSKAGLSNEKIVQLAQSVGITEPQFASSLNNGDFGGWVEQVADLGSKAGVNGTPTIYIKEQQVDTAQLANSSGQFDPAVLTQRIQAAAG
jgi:protein-disulfide isomerase